MEKIRNIMVNLIVDIDIILGSYAVARGKSGVFVVADNVIKRLAERPDLKISFSCCYLGY